MTANGLSSVALLKVTDDNVSTGVGASVIGILSLVMDVVKLAVRVGRGRDVIPGAAEEPASADDPTEEAANMMLLTEIAAELAGDIDD